jgi:hypothetical protein
MPLRHLLFFLVTSISFLLTSQSEAGKIQGATDQVFVDTVEAWLLGDDLAALESFAQLSRDGNSAAQILLASIATRGNMHSHVTSGLSRKERVALLRIPKGLSGKSWLSEAQTKEPLATALMQSTRIGEKAPAIAALVELGEPTIALLAAQSILYQGEANELIEALQGLEGELPDEASVLLLQALLQAGNTGSGYAGSARVGTLVLKRPEFRKFELAWLPPSPRGLVEDAELRLTVINLSDEVQSWTPMRNFCRANCGESTQACTAVAASALFSVGPFSMRSPAESLISNELYWASPRVGADMARQIRDVNEWRSWREFTRLNSCFFEKMRDVQEMYGHAD